LIYDTYLGFARGLTKRFADRVVGLDSSTQRIIKLRPSDQILGGFLTPAHTEQADENGPAEDLPQDSAYEQTSLGLEWLVSPAACSQALAEVKVSVCLYVRVMPTFDEQAANLSWEAPRRSSSDSAARERQAEIVPVWWRVDLDNLAEPIKLGDLIEQRKLIRSLSDQLKRKWEQAKTTIPDRYPTASSLTIKKSQFTRDGFSSWRREVKPTTTAGNWSLDLDARFIPVPTEPGLGRLSLRVINRTPERGSRSTEFFDANLYAPRLSVLVPSDAHRCGTLRELEQSYRYDLSLPAIGLNCHVAVDHRGGSVVLQTNSVPTTEMIRLEPRRLEPSATPTFQRLQADPITVLRRMLDAMKSYDATQWNEKVGSLTGQQQEEAEGDRRHFQRDEINAFERGIELLENPRYPLVLKSFRLMNEAMSDVATGRGLDPRLTARRKYEEWRLFQIVFIVTQLPILATREHPELERDGDDSVDVLWFAAGGGKTEAFLGLIVWQAFFDRMRGKTFGPAAFVRFPLRLLAFQQLQRTARALAAADLIRIRENLGGTQFSLGYYVGSTQTPNDITSLLHQRYSKLGIEARARRLAECPYCAGEVRATYDADLRIIEHRCGNHSCPGGRGKLPIYIVDRDIERFLPTVIVATVDKLAQFGQQQRFANLFGRVSLMCWRHGASFRDVEGRLCSAAKEISQQNRTGPLTCSGAPVSLPPFRDLSPALLIQDELHLLSEELGSFDAHYETAVMHLAKTIGCRPWKIVAATATITRFEDHAQQLYLKHARQFPAPGPEANESFYYTASEGQVGRIFVGVLGVGRKHTPAVTKALSLIYQELQLARDLSRRDIASACARYGLPLIKEETFREMLFYYELALTYVLTRKGSDQVAEAIESRVKRELEEVTPSAGELRVETFNGSVDMGEMIESMREIERADPALAPEERTRGLVTTNIIGHGVDVERFNIIVFAGFTRLVAEYIQASARVGRRFPGISILVATPQSERDRSIYERFNKFHEYLDRLVDPSAVNRWPVPALQRTLPGILAGYLMGGAAALMNCRLESVDRVQRAVGTPGSEPLLERNVVGWLKNALGAEQRAGFSDAVDNIGKNVYARVLNAEPSATYLDNLLNHRLRPMRSLRDVDEPAEVSIESKIDTAIMRALRNG
jgi:Helicase conserved C-terminal domain